MPPKTIKVVLFRSGGGFGERSARIKIVSSAVSLIDDLTSLDTHSLRDDRARRKIGLGHNLTSMQVERKS
jgi:hypothetical protein